MNKNKEWYDNFITEEDGIYTVWDESQSHEIGTTCYYTCALAMLDAYIDILHNYYMEQK